MADQILSLEYAVLQFHIFHLETALEQVVIKPSHFRSILRTCVLYKDELLLS